MPYFPQPSLNFIKALSLVKGSKEDIYQQWIRLESRIPWDNLSIDTHDTWWGTCDECESLCKADHWSKKSRKLGQVTGAWRKAYITPIFKTVLEIQGKACHFCFWPMEDSIASRFETLSGCLKVKVVENNQHGFTKAKLFMANLFAFYDKKR